jgi:hypothetical protein
VLARRPGTRLIVGATGMRSSGVAQTYRYTLRLAPGLSADEGRARFFLAQPDGDRAV